MHSAGLESINVRLMSQQDRSVDDEIGSREQPQDLEGFVCDNDRPVLSELYSVTDANAMFDALIKTTYAASLAGDHVRQTAREIFQKEWAKLVSNGNITHTAQPGRIEEVDGVFVGIGFKPVGGERRSDSVLEHER